MKRFLKLNAFALVALLFLGVADAWGLGIKKNVALNFSAEGDKGSWNAGDKQMTWTANTYNLLFLTDWYDCDLSQYDKMVINTSTVTTGNWWNSQTANANYRVLIRIDEKNYTCSLTGGGEQVINIKTDFKDENGKTPEMIQSGDPLRAVQSIRIGGRSGNGSIKINSIYFHKPLEWDSFGNITFNVTDFNLDNNVTRNGNTFTFNAQNASISLDFDSNNDLATTEIESIDVNITGSTDRIKQGFNNTNTKDLSTAQRNKVSFGKFLIFNESRSTKPTITFNSVTFTKKKYTFDVTKDRLYFEDFEHLTQASLLDESKAPAANTRPDNNQVGKYYLYGGRGKILKDPTFNNYYQNLADADEYTKSLSQNFLRYIFTDNERNANVNAIKKSGAATIGFWVNGQVAVDYELPLERGSMFCIFSNDCFAKADAGNVREKDRPRFMFDLSCNGWVYSYMPNTDGNGVDLGNNYFFYGEKIANSGVQNPLGSLFGKDNYTNTLDQSQHKFYDDKKWHYVTYVMDNNLTRVKIYLDGNLTGTVENVTKLPNTDHSECEFSGNNDYIGRTLYLRNIVLGGLTPHGLFYDQQYYSDAALAYDDIAMYGRALTQDEIRSIIEQKNYTPNEWHYGDSFTEYNEIKGGHEQENNVSGLNLSNASFDNTTHYLKVNGGVNDGTGTTLTIPSVPKNYYVRIEYAYANQSGSNAFPGTVGKLTWIGSRVSENNSKLKKTFDGQTYYVRTYKATESGTYTLNIGADVLIRSIIITPYEYAKLKFGNWNEGKSTFTTLPVNKKYVKFDVERINGRNFYKKDGVDVGENPVLPEVSLAKDGRFGDQAYENIDNYREDLNHYPYIKYTSTAPHVAHINKKGDITMTGIAGNTTIIAELISDNQFVGSEVIDSFEIRILKEENTLRLTNKQAVKVNEKFPGVNSNKNLDNITLTIGGWNHTSTYIIPGVPKPAQDGWNRAVNFQGPIKPREEILDDFNQYSIGKNVAKSESLGNDDGEFHPGEAFANNITPWTLPCRGAYVKFEPVKPGIVTMYLLQNGNLDNRLDDDGHSTHVYWRPVYITDEKGQVVDFVQTATNGRITYKDNFFIGDKRRAQFIESIEATYNEDPSLRQDLLNLKEKDINQFHTLIDNWNNAGWRQKVIPTGDGGYMVMSKAIVRYTFNVYPGKTYYLFSNQSQIAISGFNFEEDRLLDTKTQNYETAPVRDVVEGTSLTFTDVLNGAQPEIPTNGKGKDITHVTYERNFAQGKWSSICLPFSMNNRQMREQFGEETAVVLLKNIHDDGKIELIWHVNQDIIAGYPYFILPKGDVKHNNVANSTITKISVDTYFNNEIQKDRPLFSVGSNGNTFDWQGTYNGSHYRADYPYVFEGNFKNEELPAGSYVMSNNGTLSKLKKATTAKPFRAYLKYQGSDANNAKPLYTSVNWQNDDETTGIDDIIFQNGILMESSDVYSIDGTVIRRDAQNLSNLSKGVYIVNGKKFVVK